MPPRSRNIKQVDSRVEPSERRRAFGHGPATVWLTGLSGSGKSAVAFSLEETLLARGVAAYVLDGDNVRFGLNRDLGFSPDDRTENIRRIGEVCRLMYDAGLIVIAAFISPYRADRDGVRALHPSGGFVEVHLNTPIEVCEARDVKGLYAKARAGEIPDFSGIGAPYEPPESPELRLDTGHVDLSSCVDAILARLVDLGVMGHELTA